MRTRAVVVLALLALVLSGCAQFHELIGDDGTSGSSASSVGPYVDDQGPDGQYGAPPPTVHPGDTVVLHGHWFTSTCNDAGQDDPTVPLPDGTLTVTLSGGATQTLGPFAPGGEDMGFDAIVTVPADTPPGTVTVDDGSGGPPYTFSVG